MEVTAKQLDDLLRLHLKKEETTREIVKNEFFQDDDLIDALYEILELDGYVGRRYIQDDEWDFSFLLSHGRRFITLNSYTKIEEKEKQEIALNESVIQTNKSSKRSNFWSPFFAGLAAVIALTSLTPEILRDKKQEWVFQGLHKQTTRQDSLLQIQQKQIDSLLITIASRDTLPY